jgi:hypothetical protein
MQLSLAVIDIDIASGQDELAREQLLENIRQCTKLEYITPLWVNTLRERADLRVVCLVHDMAKFDDFLVDVIRSVPGVRGTTAQLAFDGVVRGDSLLDVATLESAWGRRAAATVQVQVQPGLDQVTYEALLNLPPHQEVQVVWVAKVFHSTHADLQLLLLGERTASLTGFVMSWVRTVSGVLDTQLSSVLDWHVLGETEDFIALAERFSEARDQRKEA